MTKRKTGQDEDLDTKSNKKMIKIMIEMVKTKMVEKEEMYEQISQVVNFHKNPFLTKTDKETKKITNKADPTISW